MTSSTVKCERCNVVINELLAFIANKIDVMDQESLMRICVSSFDVAEVEKSKKLLFDAVTTDIRNVKRRNKCENKIQRDLEDIITVLKSLDPDTIPIFVARELHKLPPLTFDHCDVSAILKDIVLLKSQVQEIMSTCVTTEQLHALEAKFHSCKYDSLINTSTQKDAQTFNYVNTRARGAYLLESGPMAIGSMYEYNSTPPEPSLQQTPTSRYCAVSEQQEVNEETATACHYAEYDNNGTLLEAPSSIRVNKATAACGARPVSGSKPVADRAFPSACSATTLSTKATAFEPVLSLKDARDNLTEQPNLRPTFAEISNRNGLWHEPLKDEEWELVQRKRLRNKIVTNKGKACLEQNSKFKAADIRIPLFITNVHKEVVGKDIAEYILTKTQEKVEPIRIKMKRSRDYNAFKIYVAKSKLETFLDDSFWPSGISFRRFVNYIDNSHARKAHENETVFINS